VTARTSGQERPAAGVPVTGVGAITPLGRNAVDTWRALCEGRSGLTNERSWLEHELPHFKKLRTHLAGRVRDYDLLDDSDFADFGRLLKRKDQDREISRAATLALRACAEALDRAGLLEDELKVPVDATRFAVVLGSGIGGASGLNKVARDLAIDRRPQSTQMYRIQPDNPTVVVKRLFGAKGPSLSVSQACASGGIAVALAAMMIERDEADVVIAGGAEALDASVVALFEATGAATDSDDPACAVQPFDVSASGAALAEGAGVLVLESDRHARARGAEILAFVAGSGITGGGGSPTLMEEEGLVRAMLLGLERAGLSTDDRIAINPHATGTRAGDRAEASAIRRLADRAENEPLPRITRVFPIKGNMGHTIGASGGIEAVISVVTLGEEVVPPAATTPDPLDDIRALMPSASQPTALAADAVLSNSMGFGDQTVALVIRGAP
jgi:3-oxoacyl-(acyl-carrier-protein) synthase